MSQAAGSSSLSQDQADAFNVQVLRYLDGDCTPDEIRRMQEQLSGSAEHRALFVRACRLFGGLHENYAAKRAEWQAKSANAPAVAARSIARSAIGAPSGERPEGVPVEHDVSVAAELLAGDPGAETIVHNPSPDDTVNPGPPKKRA